MVPAKSPWHPALAIAAGLAIGGLSIGAAMAKPAASNAPVRPNDAVAGPLPSAGAESRIRALAASTRPTAATQLADLSRSAEVKSDARTLLLAIRALAGFAEHDAAEQALLHHLREPSAGDEPSRRSLARAVAALALAAAARPGGVRALVLLASGPDDVDAELAEQSRAALLAHSPSPEQLRAAFPWQDDAARRARMTWLAQARGEREKWRSERCQKARARLPELPKLSVADAAGALVELADCGPSSGPTLEDWRQLAKTSHLWTLRGLAAMGPGAHTREWQELAEAELAQGEPTARSAAAWFLATTSPSNAERLSRDRRAEVRAAAKNQLLANRARPSGREACAGLSGGDSTRRLFEHYLERPNADGDPVLGCLASRLRDAPGPGITPSELDGLLEGSPAMTRLVVAQGLGAAESEGHALARGLAERLYAVETDDTVRRSLCGALVRLGLSPEQRLARELATLDPDPVCRALGAGHAWVSPGIPLLAVATSGGAYVATRVLAAPVSLEPAPDGFVGARVVQGPGQPPFDTNFVDCEEPGEPAWACGTTLPRPR